MFGFAEGSDFALDYGEFTGAYADLVLADPHFPNGRPFPHGALFSGAITPGMSGGPVFDLNGRVVGINNATASSYSAFRQLADTALCEALKPAPTE